MTGGTLRQLGSQKFIDFLTGVRAASAEGLEAANNRLLGPSDLWAFCGSTIWRNKISLGVCGGHSAGYDDGHYAQDLATGAWEVLLPCSAQASRGATATAEYGEWTPNRPASAHSFFHLVTAGDDIIYGAHGAIGYQASRSGQAFRWKGSLNGGAGAWERYGDNGHMIPPQPHAVLYDPRRNRIMRIPLTMSSNVLTIPANNASATWTVHSLLAWPPTDIYQSIGYHEAQDCYVMVDQHQTTTRNRAWVMDPDNLRAGWIEVPVRGSTPDLENGGLEYVPPMQAFAAASTYEPATLYYLAPTAGRFGAWSWAREVFTGPVTAAPWESSGGTAATPWSRMRWSSSLGGLVLLKSTGRLTEVFTPSTVAARN